MPKPVITTRRFVTINLYSILAAVVAAALSYQKLFTKKKGRNRKSGPAALSPN
jgi:hypothetical protein